MSTHVKTTTHLFVLQKIIRLSERDKAGANSKKELTWCRNNSHRFVVFFAFTVRN